MKPTLVFDHQETVVDGETGVIHSQSRTTKSVIAGKEPNYVKLYLDDISYLHNMQPAISNVLYELLKRATYAGDNNGMMIYPIKSMKEDIANELNIKLQSVNNAITKLVKGHVLIPQARATYQFNPWLFGKGDWKDIAKLRLTIDYSNIRGRNFNTEIAYDNQCQ